MSDYYQFRDEIGNPIDYYQLVNDNNELCKEVERLNDIVNKIYTFLSQYTITHTWQKVVIEDTIKYIDELQELKEGGNNE